MATAWIWAKRSSCSRLQVGCVISNEDFTKIDAIGYNGGAKGLENDCESLEPGMCGHLHSEINALIKANYDIPNKRMFITHSPCKQCTKAIINGRIAQVYYNIEYRDKEPLAMLARCGIAAIRITEDFSSWTIK